MCVAHLKLKERLDLMLDEVVRVISSSLGSEAAVMKTKEIRVTIKTIVFRLNDNEAPKTRDSLCMVFCRESN